MAIREIPSVWLRDIAREFVGIPAEEANHLAIAWRLCQRQRCDDRVRAMISSWKEWKEHYDTCLRCSTTYIIELEKEKASSHG